MITLLRDAPFSRTNTALTEPFHAISFIGMDSILGGHTGILVTVARTTTVVLPVAQINIALDHAGRRQRDNAAHPRGNVQCLGTGEANETEDDGASVHLAELMVDCNG